MVALGQWRFLADGGQNRFGVQRRLSVIIGRAGIAQAGGEHLQQHAERDAEDGEGHQDFEQGKTALRRHGRASCSTMATAPVSQSTFTR